MNLAVDRWGGRVCHRPAEVGPTAVLLVLWCWWLQVDVGADAALQENRSCQEGGREEEGGHGGTEEQSGLPLSAGAGQPHRSHQRILQHQGTLPEDRRLLRFPAFGGECQ